MQSPGKVMECLDGRLPDSLGAEGRRLRPIDEGPPPGRGIQPVEGHAGQLEGRWDEGRDRVPRLNQVGFLPRHARSQAEASPDSGSLAILDPTDDGDLDTTHSADPRRELTRKEMLVRKVSTGAHDATVELTMPDVGVLIDALAQELGLEEPRVGQMDEDIRDMYMSTYRFLDGVMREMDAIRVGASWVDCSP